MIGLRQLEFISRVKRIIWSVKPPGGGHEAHEEGIRTRRGKRKNEYGYW
jgi:hypothetical protein